MNRTIAKNRVKKIEEIFNQATDCKVYTLDNCFNGKECSTEAAKKELFQFSFSRLTFDVESGIYQVHVHSNCWYEFRLGNSCGHLVIDKQGRCENCFAFIGGAK